MIIKIPLISRCVCVHVCVRACTCSYTHAVYTNYSKSGRESGVETVLYQKYLEMSLTHVKHHHTPVIFIILVLLSIHVFKIHLKPKWMGKTYKKYTFQ